MRRLWCTLISVGFVSGALAEKQFWVVVGSYQDPAYAERALGRANAGLREFFTIAFVDIEADRWYRVLAGPYPTRGVADLTAVQARQVGFDGAWMLATESTDLGMEDDYGAGDEYATDGDYGELPGFEAAYPDSVGEYPDIESLLPPVVPADEADKYVRKPERELVQEVPDGYELHKLRRGGG